MLNVFMMRTQEIGLHATSGTEHYGLVFHSDGIVTAGNSDLQGEKMSYLKSNVLGSMSQTLHSTSVERGFE